MGWEYIMGQLYIQRGQRQALILAGSKVKMICPWYVFNKDIQK
jgi:hypothetical protein